jgi:hypothetical protein
MKLKVALVRWIERADVHRALRVDAHALERLAMLHL